jgi:hypothetical protein
MSRPGRLRTSRGGRAAVAASLVLSTTEYEEFRHAVRPAADVVALAGSDVGLPEAQPSARYPYRSRKASGVSPEAAAIGRSFSGSSRSSRSSRIMYSRATR